MRYMLLIVVIIAAVFISAPLAHAQSEVFCPGVAQIDLIPNEMYMVSQQSGYRIFAGQTSTGIVYDNGVELPTWPQKAIFTNDLVVINQNQSSVRTLIFCYSAEPTPTRTSKPVFDPTATPTPTTTGTATATPLPTGEEVCPIVSNGDVLWRTGSYMVGTSVNNNSVITPVNMSIYKNLYLSFSQPVGISNFFRHYFSNIISSMSAQGALWTTGNAPISPWPGQTNPRVIYGSSLSGTLNHTFAYFVDNGDPGVVQVPAQPISVCLVGERRVAVTATWTRTVTPIPSATATATSTPTNTSTPTSTPTSTVGAQGCAGAEYQVPVAPLTVDLPMVNGGRFVSEAEFYVNMPSRALLIRAGEQYWTGATGSYVAYSLGEMPIRVVVCLVAPIPTATLTATFVSTPMASPVLGSTPICLPIMVLTPTIGYVMPDLSINIPTLRPLTATPTGTITATPSLSTTAMIGIIATVQVGISTPMAAVQTASSGYSWAAGVALSATASSGMQPALAWLAVLNPATPAWQTEGGPLWALAPAILPILPIIGAFLTIAIARFLLWLTALILTLVVDPIIKLIELIPGE